MDHSVRLWLEKLRRTGFESRPGRKFVVKAVLIQYLKRVKCLEGAVPSMVLCRPTIRNLGSHSITVRHSTDFGLPLGKHKTFVFDVGPTLYKYYTNILCFLGFCLDIVMIVQKAT